MTSTCSPISRVDGIWRGIPKGPPLCNRDDKKEEKLLKEQQKKKPMEATMTVETLKERKTKYTTRKGSDIFLFESLCNIQ